MTLILFIIGLQNTSYYLIILYIKRVSRFILTYFLKQNPPNTFINNPTDWGSMAKEKKPEMRYQCLKCYRTYKTEQKALDCCGSMIQAWCINYNKWGKQHWYGR